MFLTKTSGLTREANGLIGKLIFCLVCSNCYECIAIFITGQFLTADVHVDEDDHLIKLNDGQPISVKKGPIWRPMEIAGDCWYRTATDNQGTGIISGVYTDYIVEDLVTPTN